MAEARPFRALRFDASRVDLAQTIAPPYDVISREEQRGLYDRSPYNVVRIEYGEQTPTDTDADSRYTRAATDIAAWTRDGVLTRERFPAMYAYRQEFTWEGRTHVRQHVFAAVRLEPWDAGVIKPHEHTLSGPKADRLDLLRATATQISPVYCLYRQKDGVLKMPPITGRPLYDIEADGQRHVLTAITDDDTMWAISAYLQACDVYIADGHHRYETALKYRDECREAAASWSGEEPANFVLMALTESHDPGLLVLPTHRLVHRDQPDAFYAMTDWFNTQDLGEISVDDAAMYAARVAAAGVDTTAFIAVGVHPGRTHLLTLRDRRAIEHLLPDDQPASWKHLDVSVLQYGVLKEIFGVDDAALAAGGSVSYTQDAREAIAAVLSGTANCAFLLNATPVKQVLAVSDAGGRMPQKSTFFHPKLPTGLVMNPVSPEA